jgi:hypothetical protein
VKRIRELVCYAELALNAVCFYLFQSYSAFNPTRLLGKPSDPYQFAKGWSGDTPDVVLNI